MRSILAFRILTFLGVAIAAMFIAPGAISIAAGSRAGGSRTSRRLIKFRVTGGAGGNGETDTGLDLPDNCLVDWNGIAVNVLTAEVTGATKTIGVGLLSSESGGVASGFINGLSVATTGMKFPAAAITVGGTESYYATNTLGTLLSYFLAGANVAGDVGTFEPKLHPSDAVVAKSISVSFPNNMTELVCDVYIPIIVLEP